MKGFTRRESSREGSSDSVEFEKILYFRLEFRRIRSVFGIESLRSERKSRLSLSSIISCVKMMIEVGVR
jgi:hypothetical protein